MPGSVFSASSAIDVEDTCQCFSRCLVDRDNLTGEFFGSTEPRRTFRLPQRRAAAPPLRKNGYTAHTASLCNTGAGWRVSSTLHRRRVDSAAVRSVCAYAFIVSRRAGTVIPFGLVNTVAFNFIAIAMFVMAVVSMLVFGEPRRQSAGVSRRAGSTPSHACGFWSDGWICRGFDAITERRAGAGGRCPRRHFRRTGRQPGCDAAACPAGCDVPDGARHRDDGRTGPDHPEIPRRWCGVHCAGFFQFVFFPDVLIARWRRRPISTA